MDTDEFDPKDTDQLKSDPRPQPLFRILGEGAVDLESLLDPNPDVEMTPKGEILT